MKATNMMREMMVAASLFVVSACGAVTAPDGDVGSGSGSGSGSNGDVDPSCEVASDCTGGAACDLSAHECVTDAITLEGAEFINDGVRWWSTTSGPKLLGSFLGGNGAVVQVKVGSGAAIAATIGGSSWSVQLPTGTIQSRDTLVSVTMTDPERGIVALEQLIALDNAAPIIGVGPSKLRDERGDVIDFLTGTPVHDHKGAEIDLAAGGCPKVYKYSYLMDTHAPMYGGELTGNPIAWSLTVQDSKVASVEFLVRDGQGNVLRDWKPIVGTGASYPLVLYRDGAAGIGDLATKAGQYTIEVRARDWGGLLSSTSYCIDLQPLAAPLAISQASIPNDADALASWSLVANSPISRLTNGGNGTAIVEQKITQYSSEPVVLSLDSSAPTGTWRTQFVQGWVASYRERIFASCANMNCDMIAAPAVTSWSGALSSYAKTLQLVDASGNVVPAQGGMWTVPGRAAGAPAAEYRVRVRLSNVTHYGSNSAFVYGEYLNGFLNYTGTVSNNTTSACASVDQLNNCTSRATYQYIRGIDTIGLTVNPITVQLGVAASSATAFARPAHVSASTFVAPGFTWDGGNENTF